MTIPTNIPLTDEQKTLPSGAIMPSGEANFYDVIQDPSNHGESGINAVYPSPDDFSEFSGIYKTNPPDVSTVEQPSFLAYDGIDGGSISDLSSAKDYNPNNIVNFAIFNTYIHYDTANVIEIPYLSDYIVITD